VQATPPGKSVIVPLSVNIVPTPLDEALLGYWAMDLETTDASANLNHGEGRAGNTLAAPSAVSAFVNGKKVGALSLNGTSEWLRVAPSQSINSINDRKTFSVAAWLLSNNTTGAHAISRAGAGALTSFALGVFADGKFFAQVGAGGIVSPTKASPGWNHVVLTFDGLVPRLYVNGLQTAMGGGLFIPAVATTPLVIGANVEQIEIKRFWKGAIDEVRLYGRALTLEEINADRNR